MRGTLKLLSAAVVGIPSITLAQTVSDASIPIATHATGFAQPTGMAFLGKSPNDFFVIEKGTGKVFRSLNGTTITTPVLDLNVINNSERGLLGIALDPSFASNHYVYLYYSATSGAADSTSVWTQNQLSRFTWNGTSLGSESVVKVLSVNDGTQNNGPNHDAGPIAFGPDGKLYGTTGDLNRDRAEQNNQAAPSTSAGVGGVYRINTDGSNPADNPFSGNANPAFHQWYSYGLRNSFGINFDPLTGTLWDTENGPASYDEINRITPGMNSGWNEIMGPASRDAQGTSTLVNLPGSTYVDPKFSWLQTIAPTGIDFGANSLLDVNYRDAVITGDSNLGNLSLFRLNANRDGFVLTGTLADQVADNSTERDLVKFGQSFGAVSQILTGPDGGIYVVSVGNGNIYRLGGKSWRTDANANWETSSNWQGGMPSITDDVANFFGTISADRSIALGGSKFMKGVVFASPYRYTLTGGTLFNFSSSSGPAYLRVLEGSHTIDRQVQMSSNLSIDILSAASVMTVTGSTFSNTVTTVTKNGPGTYETAALVRAGSGASFTTSLVVNDGKFKILRNGADSGTSALASLTINAAKLDLTNNKMVLTSAIVGAWNSTNYDGITGLIRSGRNNGNWNGNGIVTSETSASPASQLTSLGIATAANIKKTTFGGQTVSPTDIVVAFTYVGDANLSGKIDGDDYFQIDSNYNKTANSAKSWFNGDFNYDGSINGDDYMLIDAAFAQQTTPYGNAALAGVSIVPEPGMGGLIVCATVAAATRRRRRA